MILLKEKCSALHICLMMKNVEIDLLKPADDEIEITTIGPGFKNGESVVIHYGDGNWMIIDSCKANDEVLPLEYLSAINVSFDNVKVVVCSHWHQDHYLGLHDILQKCKNAEFKIGKIGNFSNFVQYILKANALQTNRADGWKEFEKCLDALETIGKRKPQYLYHDQLIDYNDKVDINLYCFGPSDEAMNAFDKLLVNLDISNPQEIKLNELKENMVSLSVTLSHKKNSALIGCDAEVNRSNKYAIYDCRCDCDKAKATGFCNVIHESKVFARLIPFSFVKISHHSSVTGYCPKFWEEDVKNEILIGVTTIFKTSKGENLPQKDMLTKHQLHCAHHYITCNKTENKPMPQMDNNEDIMEISEDDFPGIVVCRWNTTNGETSRFLFGSAIEISDDFLDKYHNDVEESEK